MTLEKEWAREKIPYAREPKNLPDALSGTEVLQVLQAFKSHKHKTIAIVCYGAGLRVSEAISLRTVDIDSKRLVIHVREGKGQKDRQVTLSPRLLTSLRSYWVKEQPRGYYLFPGRGKSIHITKRAFCRALRAMSCVENPLGRHKYAAFYDIAVGVGLPHSRFIQTAFGLPRSAT